MASKLYNSDITVYNRYQRGLPPFGGVGWDKTVIRGVHWEEDLDKNPDSNGRATVSQTVLILIPKGVDQSGKTYLPPSEYNRVTNDNDKFWTLEKNEDNLTYIIKGEGRDIGAMYTIQELERDGGVKVKGVSDFLDSNVMPHLEVRCI